MSQLCTILHKGDVIMNSFEKIYKVKKEYSKEDFLRNVLIGLSKDEKSPSNLMDAKFSDVVEFDKEVLVVGANVEVSYSGSVGYERQEEYIEYEEKYDRELQRNVTKPVKKTRTVTDWRPHSGSLSTSEVNFAINEDGGELDFASLFTKAIKEAKDEDVVEGGNATVNSDALRCAIADCEFGTRWKVRWPGDRHKDESYNYKTDVTSLECFIVPCYEVEFSYGGKTYNARGVAIGGVNEIHETPEADANIESVEKIQKRGKRQIETAEKPLAIRNIFKIILILSAIMTFVFLGMGLIYNFYVPMIISIVVLAISILIVTIISVKVRKKVAFIEFTIAREKKKLSYLKTDKLVAKLKSLGLKELSVSEKNAISNKDDY